ncbi:unnamed protein product [Polarella glacialis]|uniref:Tubulin--tyrosine ligase-like protein 9 n=1 Tax=Polarella glacialis TaxID=89957 RepID=A0A813JKZ5_POLGL|nr:unnamed protein product [Polarella glacialis]CAE8679402.1 unnamed protein product [Polarella glacialis]
MLQPEVSRGSEFHQSSTGQAGCSIILVTEQLPGTIFASDQPRRRPPSAGRSGARDTMSGRLTLAARPKSANRNNLFSTTVTTLATPVRQRPSSASAQRASLSASASVESLAGGQPSEEQSQPPPSPAGSSRPARPRSAPAGRREQGQLESLELVLRRRDIPKQEMVAEYLRRSRQFEQVDAAAVREKVFLFDGPDEHIRQALLQRDPPWAENKVPSSQLWDFKWSVTDAEHEYRDLQDCVLFNHFQNNRELTTKVGLANSLRMLAVDEQVDIDAFFPRCYDMSATSEREDFILDYRRCAALNVVKQHVRLKSTALSGLGGGSYVCDLDVLRTAVRALQLWLKDLDGSYFDDELAGVPREQPLSRQDWDALVLYSEVSDALLCSLLQEDGERRRERNRGYSASGTAILPPQHGGSPPRPKSTQRSSDVRAWPELCKHVWLQSPPDQLEEAAKAALTALEAWPQIGTQGPMNVWVVKPGTSSKGSGVVCMQSLPEVLHHCKTASNRIVQKYVELPLLLYGGRKFDIRQWVLVRSFEPLKAYMFSSCYLRFCNEPYDLGDLANRQRHISNWAVNRHGKHVAEGAVASLDELIEVLQQITGQGRYWEEKLAPQLQHTILSCLKAVRHKVVQRSACFELYGFDFLIGEDLKPWLLEVNLSPACESRTRFLSAMLERMSTRLLQVVIDGKLEPDGIEPDWICISDEALDQLVGFGAEDPSPVAGAPGVEPSAAALPASAPSAPSAIGPLVGKPLNLRAERRFEEAWRRQGAQALISRVARGFLCRGEARRRRRTRAAKILQRPARVWLARRCLARLRAECGAREVQRYCRRYLAAAQLRRASWSRAATRLQQTWRGKLGRRRAVARRRHLSAVRLQRQCRGWAVRRRLRAQSRLVRWWRQLHAGRLAAVTAMQAALRTVLAQRRLVYLARHVQKPARLLGMALGVARWRRQAALARASGAAIALQRRWRGCCARHKTSLRRLLRLVSRSWRSHTSRSCLAAVAIQSVRRSQLARRLAGLRRAAVREVNVAWRVHQARCRLQALRWEAIAVRLQGLMRRALASRSRAQVLRGAVAIQAGWRGLEGRRRAGSLRRFQERKHKWLATSAASIAASAAAAEREMAAAEAARAKAKAVQAVEAATKAKAKAAQAAEAAARAKAALAAEAGRVTPAVGEPAAAAAAPDVWAANTSKAANATKKATADCQTGEQESDASVLRQAVDVGDVHSSIAADEGSDHRHADAGVRSATSKVACTVTPAQDRPVHHDINSNNHNTINNSSPAFHGSSASQTAVQLNACEQVGNECQKVGVTASETSVKVVLRGERSQKSLQHQEQQLQHEYRQQHQQQYQQQYQQQHQQQQQHQHRHHGHNQQKRSHRRQEQTCQLPQKQLLETKPQQQTTSHERHQSLQEPLQPELNLLTATSVSSGLATAALEEVAWVFLQGGRERPARSSWKVPSSRSSDELPDDRSRCAGAEQLDREDQVSLPEACSEKEHRFLQASWVPTPRVAEQTPVMPSCPPHPSARPIPIPLVEDSQPALSHRGAGFTKACESHQTWEHPGDEGTFGFSASDAAAAALKDLRNARGVAGLSEAASAAAATAAAAAATCGSGGGQRIQTDSDACWSSHGSDVDATLVYLGRSFSAPALGPRRPWNGSVSEAAGGPQSGGSALRAARQIRSSASVTILVSDAPDATSNYASRQPPKERPPLPSRRPLGPGGHKCGGNFAAQPAGGASSAAGQRARSASGSDGDDWWLRFRSPETQAGAGGCPPSKPSGQSRPQRPRSAIARIPTGEERLQISTYLLAPGISAASARSAAARRRSQSAMPETNRAVVSQPCFTFSDR